MYYIANHIELTREDGGFVQFLDAAKALNVNRLHYTGESKLVNFKTYYEFVHAQRNAESHTAPVREDTHVPIGIHMAMAMYLYATMINITNMERSGIIHDTSYMRSHLEAEHAGESLEDFKARQSGYAMAAEPGPDEK